MSKVFTFLLTLVSLNCFSQNIFFDDFSTLNLAKIDGQGGWSTSTPSLGNGTGACFSFGCQVQIASKAMTYSSFGICTQALNPIDGPSATQDGPGKSIGSAINSGSVYVALLVNFNTPLASPTAAKQVIRFMDNSVTSATRIYIKQITSGGAFQVGVDKNNSSPIYTSSSYGFGQDHLIILKYKFNTSNSSDDVAAVFIDPDLTQPEPLASATASGSTDATSITRVAFPWNTNSLPNGYIGMVSVSKDWNNLVPQASINYTIDGKILSPLNKSIKNAKTSLTSSNLKDSTLSNALGSYSFSNLPSNNFNIKPTKNNDIAKANGVTSVDVLLTQRHILNTTKLNNAYKLIAADVNGDKAINSVDVLRIKRLILGTDTTFTKGSGANKVDRQWEFIDSAYIFPDTTNPFPFKDSISFTNLTSNKTNQTFIGVKLGDVNYDWNPAVAKLSTVNSVQLTANTDLKIVNGELRIPISVNNFKDIAAMQYTLHFDNTKYKFVNLEGFKNLQGFEYNLAQANTTGNISMLWTDKNAEPKTLEDGTELFTFVLQSTVNSSQLTDFALTNDITEIEAWDNDFNQHNIILTKQQKLQTSNTEQWSVSPNPTNGDIKVNIASKVNKTVSLELTDAQGKLILKRVAELQKGNNSITLNLKQNSNITTGIYFLKAVGLDDDNVRKILVK